jgi:hypothetical protein
MATIIQAFLVALLIGRAPTVESQVFPKDLKDKIDSIIASVYQEAQLQFPCKVGSGGKFRMMNWPKVDSCLNNAAGRVDWEGVSKQLETLRSGPSRISVGDFSAQVEASLSAHALPLEKVFTVKDERALLPLTNSVLKFLPADSFHDLAVFDRTGSKIGIFAGVYTYERVGGLASANTYRLTLFQYTDGAGNVQSATDKLLLDSYGVPWKDARTQPGFRLNSDKLDLKR